MVADHHIGYGSGLNLNRCRIGHPGCQHPNTVNLGAVGCKFPNLSELGELSQCRPAGPFVDSYNALAFAV